ncbi:MAG: prepilin-type N-terminal cleavage/methylation domain-containing protein [Desulfobulbaceae bacterium]|nr:prepilin-type N-terminal cleavage/methylation domain-containing protein [Desulfobulbaceae bacterium]
MFTKKTIDVAEKGFTLIEVLMAMAIFSIGILASIAMQYRVVSGTTSGNVVNQEMMLAQWVMEQKKTGGDVTALTSAIPADVDPGPYTITITPSNPLGGSASRFMTVTVSRVGGIGGHPVTIRSLTMGNGI